MPSQHIRIGVQGARGSFSDQACALYCADHDISSTEIQYLYTAEKVLRSLLEGKIDYGILAVCNTATGIIMETLEAMSEFNFHILDIFDMSVSYAMLAKQGVVKENIKTILSHPDIIEGCKKILQEQFSGAEVRAGDGVMMEEALAASHLNEPGSPENLAVIAPSVCASLYTLAILVEKMQDTDSTTTFVWCKRR